MVDNLEQLADRIKAEFPTAGSSLAFGELTATAEAKDIVRLLAYLRDDPECEFTILIDICGVDYPNRPRRFDVVYHLLSMAKNRRIRIKIETEEASPVPSVVSVHPAADWFEREAFDMYGLPGTRCARISRSPAMSKCAGTTSRSAWSMSRCDWSRNSASSTFFLPGRARLTSCRGMRTRVRTRVRNERRHGPSRRSYFQPQFRAAASRGPWRLAPGAGTRR